MEFLVGLPILILIPFAAFRGKAYRGVYLAIAIIGFLVGAFFMGMPMGQVPGRNYTPDQIERLDAIILVIGVGLLAAGLGGLIGACLYRAPQR
jgi:hypothetical protein